jgi:hypothetical protein
MPGAPVFKVTSGGSIARPIRIGSIFAIAMATIVVVRDGIAYIASAIICPRGDVGFQVEIECLPPSVAGSEAMDRDALQHIAAGIPEVTNYYIPAIGRGRTGEIYLELVEETSLGYLEALPLTYVDIGRTCAKPGAGNPCKLAYR